VNHSLLQPQVWMSSIAIQTIGAAAAAIFTAQASPGPLVDVPGLLAPAANESLAMVVAAQGVQIYECRASSNAPAGYEWVFVAPDADLFDADGKLVGHHAAGPQWQATDGSRVVGTVKGRVDAPMAGAIPWLLLTARSDGPPGLFSAVTSVQRINTSGGVAPAAGCVRETAGAAARVDYRADYYFFTTTTS